MMFWSCFLHAVILTWSSINVSLLATSSNNERDRLALLAIKDQIREDPLGALSSWNHSLHYCQWQGVTCASRHRDRVQILDLEWQKLEGTLSPHIGNLSFLRVIWLNTNNFHGHIPQEIGRLSRLRFLSLANNSFSGEIPVVLTSLSKLTRIQLFNNHFQGTIPSSLGNLSSLTFLDLGINSLRGSIPEDLCRIRRLTIFQVADNSLTGMVPSCLYNLSNIEIFSVGGLNQLHGTLPQDIGLTLPKLRGLLVTGCNFTGFIPSSLSNASRLETLHLDGNSFIGNVPRDLGNRLQNFKRFTVGDNYLGTESGNDLDFISSLTNCTLLQILHLRNNSLKAPIPNSIANLSSQIIHITLDSNLIYGSIPVGLGNLFNLQLLTIGDNHLTGKIPKSLVMLPNLDLLYLSYNKLSGKIPDSFSNSSLLERLDLSKNQLSGSIPMSIGDCKELFELSLSHNNLSGTIPKQVIGHSSIKYYFNLSHNALSGLLPLEVANLTDLQILDISNNRLYGAIPWKLSNCLNLEYLSIEHNFFTGSIPASLGVLKGLKKLIVSHNGLTGEVPKDLQNLTSLTLLDLSYNNLEGPVPTDGVFANATAVSIVGNSKLCGGIVQLELLPCHLTKKKGKYLPFKTVLPVIFASVSLILLSCFLFLCYRRKVSKAKPSSQPLFGEIARISYAELRRATNSFTHDNLIGVGSYGSVYKGVLDHVNTIIAVKVFNLQEGGAAKSFLCECNALRNLRHRNLLKIITSCSSIDFQGNDFKALVFKYMPNGSLEDWLHSKVGALQQELRSLNFLQRLNIAIDVASALDYLHNHCQPAVVHCDLKPSNVLVDDDMTAHVADFGLAKIFSGSSYNSSQTENGSLAIKGSIGYVAPEYGLGGQVSMEGDVYSYGILLLEMFTGKRPTDDMFQDGKNLHSFARTALLDQVMNIVDPRMLLEGIEEIVNNVNQSNLSMRGQECLVSSMTLGVECSAESPNERMNIGMIVRKLYHIRNHYQGIHPE